MIEVRFPYGSPKGAVAHPLKRKTEVKAKKGFTTSVFCFKFNSCEQKNSKQEQHIEILEKVNS